MPTDGDLDRPVTEPIFIDEPRDPILRALYDYWNGLRDGRAMPRRADIDPTAIPKLLPHVLMYTVLPEGGYSIRLVGDEVVRFAGRNATGEPAGAIMPPRAKEILLEILDDVVTTRSPRFRMGRAHWQPDHSFRAFEACFLPLAGAGEDVAIVFCGAVISDWVRPDLLSPTASV